MPNHKETMAETKRVAVLMLPVRPYCRRVLRGVTGVGSQARWECILVPADAPRPVSEVRGFVHGLIGHLSDRSIREEVLRAGVPAVDISPLDQDEELPRVSTDDIAVGRVAAAHLLSLGLPHFGFFGNREAYFSLLRAQGFKEAIGAAGLSCHVLLSEPEGDADPRDAAGTDADAGPLEAWVRQLPKPIGILAGTDGLALRVLAVCRRLKIKVPQAVAVVGVDNDDVFCELAVPPLSSIALATQRIGYEAARLLGRLMAGETPPEKRLLIPPAGVIPRRSSDLPAVLDPDVAAAVRYISLHVRDDLQVADVMREVAMSRRSLEQHFLKILGRTPAAEIRRAQVETAKQVLSETDEPMARVATAAGFSSAKQLSTTFHRETGMTPTQFRRQTHFE
jgi:LacI family transcriptional regulator